VVENRLLDALDDNFISPRCRWSTMSRAALPPLP